MKIYFILILSFFPSILFSQVDIKGEYHGIYKDLPIVLKIIESTDQNFSAILNDGTVDYTITVDRTGNSFSGKAMHSLLGIKGTCRGVFTLPQVTLKLSLTILGIITDFDFKLEKMMITTKESIINNPSTPTHATLDPRVVGKWIKEENYNSGNGDNFMGSTFAQSLIFNVDGSLTEGGSSATISGSNYLGQSKSNQTNTIPDVVWYTIENQIYLKQSVNGQTQEIHLGKYYIENNHMLITNTQGVKLLLRKG